MPRAGGSATRSSSGSGGWRNGNPGRGDLHRRRGRKKRRKKGKRRKGRKGRKEGEETLPRTHLLSVPMSRWLFSTPPRLRSILRQQVRLFPPRKGARGQQLHRFLSRLGEQQPGWKTSRIRAQRPRQGGRSGRCAPPAKFAQVFGGGSWPALPSSSPTLGPRRGQREADPAVEHQTRGGKPGFF